MPGRHRWKSADRLPQRTAVKVVFVARAEYELHTEGLGAFLPMPLDPHFLVDPVARMLLATVELSVWHFPQSRAGSAAESGRLILSMRASATAFGLPGPNSTRLTSTRTRELTSIASSAAIGSSNPNASRPASRSALTASSSLRTTSTI
jgi:hypothetical protein